MKNMIMIGAAIAAFGACAAEKGPEISWSVMHPTELDPAYMHRVCEKAVEYGGVDSFEVCGNCHSGVGGLDGLLLFEPYPTAAAKVDRARVAKTRGELKGVVAEAHRIGKPVYYWHREGYLPKGLLEDLPALRDRDGEIDLLGEAFYSYLRWKLAAAFAAVPELDGFVLTLTEADFSVIHNSNADRYPPPKVVEKIVRVFCEEHEKRGKRFILRSFGSVAKDYEDIIAGGAAAAKDHRLEIETKATPYDFSPFLPDNPFLRKVPGATLGIECDGLGEFLGAGFPPCTQIRTIKRYVDMGRKAGADRYTIRIDRIGNTIFDSAQELNLFAYMRFIRNPRANQHSVETEWVAKRWKDCPKEMLRLSWDSYEMVTKMEFVDGNVTFHQHPVAPSFKFLKAGGVFSTLRDGADLHMARRLWGILSGKKTPGRAAILEEKARSVRLAERDLAMLEGVKGRLDPEEYARQHRAWTTAVKATKATAAFMNCACAYFEDMDADRDEPYFLAKAVEKAERSITAMMSDAGADGSGLNTKHSEAVGYNLDKAYFIPFRWLCREFLNEYRAERKLRRELGARADVADFVVPGGIYDDNRVDRQMHGAYPELVDGTVVRQAGNAIFPNGTIVVEFKDIPGAKVEVKLHPSGAAECAVEEKTENGIRTVTVGKKGAKYPKVVSIALVKPGAEFRKEVVKASDFGFDAGDSTRFLQAALDSGAKKVIVDRQASPWITLPLFFRSHQEVVFEKGVEIVAKKGAFKGKNDCLFTLRNVDGVKLSGYGAKALMQHDDYMSKDYPRSEWRHALNILSSTDVTVEGLELTGSGGDGVYLAEFRHCPPPKHIVLRDLVCDYHVRQGTSIITADDVLYENCTFSRTVGRPPQSGLDIEPNGKDEMLRKIVFRSCRFLGNHSTGAGMALFHHDETSPEISLVMENCLIASNRCGFSYCQSAHVKNSRRVKGSILLRGCVFEGNEDEGISLGRKPGDAMRIGIVDCVLRNNCRRNPRMADVRIDSVWGPNDNPDAIAFRNVRIEQPVERDWIAVTSMGWGARPNEKFKGEVTVVNPGGTKRIAIDERFREEYFPTFWKPGEPRRAPLAGLAVRPVDAKPGEMVNVSGAPLRDRAPYVFYATKAGEVRFRGTYWRCGKREPNRKPTFKVRAVEGDFAAEIAIPEAKDAEIRVSVPAAGLYTLAAELENHCYRMDASDVPVALDTSARPLELHGTVQGPLFVSAAKDDDFNVMTTGEGTTEAASFTLEDPSGAKVYDCPAALWWHGYRARGAKAGLWKITIAGPRREGYHLEDHHLDLAGPKPLVFLSSEKYW